MNPLTIGLITPKDKADTYTRLRTREQVNLVSSISECLR